MADVNDPKNYDANYPLVCRRDFLFSGRPYKNGMDFPARHLAVTKAKVQSLINANYLGQDFTGKKKKGKTKEDLTGAHKKHRGGGWYDVFVGTKKINNKAVRLASANQMVMSAASGRRKQWP